MTRVGDQQAGFHTTPGTSFVFEGVFLSVYGINVGLGELVWRKYHVEEQRFVYLKNLSVKFSLVIVQVGEVGCW